MLQRTKQVIEITRPWSNAEVRQGFGQLFDRNYKVAIYAKLKGIELPALLLRDVGSVGWILEHVISLLARENVDAITVELVLVD